MIAERYLPGVFLKYNSNKGYVNHDAPDSEIAQAFSHFTYVISNGQSVVLDLQGVHIDTSRRNRPHLILTDPQVVSMDRSFGPGDLGAAGIAAFWKTHRCGPTCRGLGLISGTSGLRHQPSTNSHVTAEGKHVGVRKHTSMGCAVVTVPAAWISAEIITKFPEPMIGKTKVNLRPHRDRETKELVANDIFAAWGHQAEKMSPLSAQELLKFFEIKHDEVVKGCKERPATRSTTWETFDEWVSARTSARHSEQSGQHSSVASPLRGAERPQPTTTPGPKSKPPEKGDLSKRTVPLGMSARSDPSPRTNPAQISRDARIQENQQYASQPPPRHPTKPMQFPMLGGTMFVPPSPVVSPGQFMPTFPACGGINQQPGMFNQNGFCMGPMPAIPQAHQPLQSSYPQMMMFWQGQHATLSGGNAPFQVQLPSGTPQVPGQSGTGSQQWGVSASTSANSGQAVAVPGACGGNGFTNGHCDSPSSLRIRNGSHPRGRTIVRGPNGRKLVTDQQSEVGLAQEIEDEFRVPEEQQHLMQELLQRGEDSQDDVMNFILQRKMRPSDLHFTQDTIRPVFRDGRPIYELLNALNGGAVDPLRDLDPLEVTCDQGKWWSLDNRRLWALKMFDSTSSKKAWVRVAAREPDRQFYAKRTTRNGGTCVQITRSRSPSPQQPRQDEC
mmetsp:Transcript_183271/g.581143  ORF Transcript_183271/g.581143 Transcript_183271/m.581143 type:complete len:669 (-) Transcript_183271:304-2310(-)